MLRLSKKADYALIALKYLAEDATLRTASAREIAERFGIPLELLSKVLQQLARRGLLVSQKGVNGGYQLTRSSSEISVADVIEAIDGPLALTACSLPDGRCEQFAACNVRDPLWRIKDRIISVLQAFRLSEMRSDQHQVLLTVHGRGR